MVQVVAGLLEVGQRHGCFLSAARARALEEIRERSPSATSPAALSLDTKHDSTR